MEEVNKKSVKQTENDNGKKLNKRVKKLKLFFLVFLNIIIISSLPIYLKIVLKILPPFTFLFFVFLIVYIILSPILAKKGEISWKNFQNNFFPAFLLMVSFIIFLLALPIAKNYNVIIIYTTLPLLSIFYLYILQKIKLNNEQKTALLIGFIGLFLIVFETFVEISTTKILNNFWIIIKGNVLILLSSIFFMLYLFSYKQKESKKLVSSFSLIYYTSIITMIISFLPMFFIEFQNVIFIYKSTLFQYGIEIILGVVFVIILNLIQKYLSKNYDNLSLLNIYFQPIIGIILAYFILGEKITFIALLGIFLIILGTKTIIKVLKENKKSVKKSKNNNLNKTKKEMFVIKNESKNIQNIGNVKNGDILKVQVINETKQ